MRTIATSRASSAVLIMGLVQNQASARKYWASTPPRCARLIIAFAICGLAWFWATRKRLAAMLRASIARVENRHFIRTGERHPAGWQGGFTRKRKRLESIPSAGLALSWYVTIDDRGGGPGEITAMSRPSVIRISPGSTAARPRAALSFSNSCVQDRPTTGSPPMRSTI